MTNLVLYDYWRSSAAWRVRIALNYKRLTYKSIPVNLLKGEQHAEAYTSVINPQGTVPSLALGGRVLTQSLAIMEYLEERHPNPPLLPTNAEDRATARAMAMVVACDIHPLINLRVQRYVVDHLDQPEEAKLDWYQHWVAEGFEALETMVRANGSIGRFCFGYAPSMADMCLIPQMYNARRFECDLSPYPTLLAIESHCNELPAFANAHADKQPDAVK